MEQKIYDDTGAFFAQTAPPYSPANTYRKGQTLTHHIYGFGEVVRVIGATKMDVLFRDKVRCLVHGRALSENSEEVGVFAEVASLTDVGRLRKENEDAIVVADLTSGEVVYESGAQAKRCLGRRGLLLAVADGMGGPQAGEVASRVAVEHLAGSLTTDYSVRSGAETLLSEVELANEKIWRLAEESPNLRGMGTTLTVALVCDARVTIGQVGDSRCYLLRGARLRQLTRDQTYVQSLVDSGVLTLEQAIISEYRHVLMYALGVVDELAPVITELELAQGDHLLLCSDGLTNHVTEDELREVMRHSPALSHACERLVALANERGGEDNSTVIIARFEGDALPVAGPEDFEMRVTAAFF